MSDSVIQISIVYITNKFQRYLTSNKSVIVLPDNLFSIQMGSKF